MIDAQRKVRLIEEIAERILLRSHIGDRDRALEIARRWVGI